MVSAEARRRAVASGAIYGLAGGVAMASLRGFTVDDALITARVAANLHEGLGHRFNAGGAVVDAVTPLGFEYVLALPASGGPLVAMYFAKWLGALSGFVVACWVGITVERTGGRAVRHAVLAPFALCSPLWAWCVSGMETGVVTLLATAALPARPWAALAGGLAAALRPELVPWALALWAGRGLVARAALRERLAALAATLGPPTLVAAVRAIAFGQPAPLAAFAKPSDLSHGAWYAAAALIWTGLPALAVAPRTLGRIDPSARAVLVAFAVHVVAVSLAGGDWMPLFRLVVPVLPGVAVAGAAVLAEAAPWASGLRLFASTTLCATLLVDKGAAVAGVGEQRLRLVREGRPLLEGARSVAALDVGWVGASTAADVVDLAGVTDPTIGRLPGGHTSKRVPDHLLASRHVDALVLLSDGPLAGHPFGARWARVVEARVAKEAEDLGFVVHGTVELAGTPQRYLVLRLKTPLQ